jgi:hypothetical protein
MRCRLATFAACSALTLFAAIARAGDSQGQIDKALRDLLANLEHTTDPGQRRELVRQLATQTAMRAAERLRSIVRSDPDAAVRVEAAKALGESPVPECLDFLLQLAVEGGPHDVRRAIGRAIDHRSGRSALVEALGGAKDDLGRGLLVEALAEDPSPGAAGALERLARGKDPFLRVEAMRALAHHPVGRQIMAPLLVDVLKKQHDLDTILAGLDLAEGLADEEFRSIADVLATFLEPEVQGAVKAARARLAWLDAVAAALAAQKSKKDGYANAPVELPDPPPPRPRIDIVYTYDATGSVCGQLSLIKARIRREATTLANTGSDFRLGIVAYRDAPRREDLWLTKVLPLTYDLAKAEAFIDSIGAATCDSQGAGIGAGLTESMSRMGWRWTGQRHVALIADSKTGVGGEPGRCRALVKLHYDADGLKLRVWYNYRTRTQLPPDIESLGLIGGGVVESLE